MLVLSRNKGESIVIRDDIRITVIDVRGDKVRLGIDAPRDMEVHREEIYNEIKRKAAADQATNGSESDSQEIARS